MMAMTDPVVAIRALAEEFDKEHRGFSVAGRMRDLADTLEAERGEPVNGLGETRIEFFINEALFTLAHHSHREGCGGEETGENCCLCGLNYIRDCIQNIRASLARPVAAPALREALTEAARYFRNRVGNWETQLSAMIDAALKVEEAMGQIAAYLTLTRSTPPEELWKAFAAGAKWAEKEYGEYDEWHTSAELYAQARCRYPALPPPAPALAAKETL